MKKIVTLFAFFFIGISLNVNAQQSLQLEMNKVWGYNSPGNSFGITWFRTDRTQSGYAFRLTYFSTEAQPNYSRIYADLAQLDVTKRWYSSSESNVYLYGELGISGMAVNEEGREYNYSSCCITRCECGFSPITTIEYKREPEASFDYAKNNDYYTLFFLPGASAGGGLDVNFLKHFHIDFQCRLNTYYSIHDGNLLFYFHYGLDAGFRF